MVHTPRALVWRHIWKTLCWRRRRDSNTAILLGFLTSTVGTHVCTHDAVNFAALGGRAGADGPITGPSTEHPNSLHSPVSEDVSVANETDERRTHRSVVAAVTPDDAARKVLRAYRLGKPLEGWRVTQVAPVKRTT